MAQDALAVDSGQTGIKVRALDGAPFVRTYHGVQTNRDLLPQVAEAIVAAANEAGRPFPVVAVGTSGLTERDNDPDRLLTLAREAGVRELLLAHDSTTSFLGALGLRQGVVVAAGTGVVTLGVGPQAMSRVDGWGNIMGDAGSGYWIGREALDAVMRAHDGRGPQTLLTSVVQSRYLRLDQAYIELQTDPDRVRVVASFAKTVAELADRDDVAAAICRRAGAELALSAVTAARNTELTDAQAPLFCLIGSIFRAVRIRDVCTAAIRSSLPHAQVVPPDGDGLTGAERLLSVTADHPLHASIAIARRTDHV